jgi:hypothetical protein
MTYIKPVGMNQLQSQWRQLKLHRNAAWVGALAVSWTLLMGAGSALAGPPLADIRGITYSVSGSPVPEVWILVHGVGDNTDRNALSNEEGAFLVANLRPGRYQLRAIKQGFADSSVTTIDLRPQEDLRVDMSIASLDGTKGVMVASRTNEERLASIIQNPENVPLTEREKLLLERLEGLERRLEALEARQAGAGPTVAPANPRAQAASAAPSGVAALAATQPVLPQGAVDSSAAAAKPVIVASAGPLPEINSEEKKGSVAAAPVPVAASIPATPPLPTLSVPRGSGNKTAAAIPQATASTPKKKIDPFSDYDWSWLNGNPRTKDIYWGTPFFTPEVRADVTYTDDFNHPADHTMGGSSEIFRDGEVQVEQLGVGGDFHWDNVRGRLMTQFGMYAETTPRNDPSPANGAWDLDTAYRYVSEAYGGYHFNVLDGVNVDAGIFMSYIGLFSYYNFDNWAYQPSFVSSNTPWFFNGVRIQFFPTPHLKIEPWIINGWQSYASANNRPGLGGQLKWTPFSWMNIISNEYGLGHDDLYIPSRSRIHTDNSIEIKYFDRPKNKGLDKMAFSFTGDLGCEYGGGVSCTGNHAGGPKQSFVGAMLYNRWWFHHDIFGVTLGGGGIDNPGRYLVLLPPINDETASSAGINSPYFTENPGDKFKAWDGSLTLDWMPKQYITFRIEGDRRHSNVAYWSGRGGITPPAFLGASTGTPNGFPTEYACNDGTPSLTNGSGACVNDGGVWYPDLRKNEFFIDLDIMVKF